MYNMFLDIQNVIPNALGNPLSTASNQNTRSDILKQKNKIFLESLSIIHWSSKYQQKSGIVI